MADDETKLSVGGRFTSLFKYHWGGMYLFLVPIALVPLCLMPEGKKQWQCGYIIAVMLAFWIPEVIPTYITGYIPIVVIPLCSILDSEKTCMAYFSDSLFFLFSALVISAAFDSSKLHSRLALSTIGICGTNPRILHLWFSILSVLLSLILSNGGTAALLIPIAKEVLTELEGQGMLQTTLDIPANESEDPYPSTIAEGLYLSIAYLSTIGGTGTCIGSDIAQFLHDYDEIFYADTFSITKYTIFALPPLIINSVLVCLYMQFCYFGLLRPNSAVGQVISAGKEMSSRAVDALKQKKADMGGITIRQVQILCLTFIWAVLLMTIKPGYADLFKPKKVEESVPSMFIAFLLFIIPANYYFLKYLMCSRPAEADVGKNSSLVGWGYFQKFIKWGLLSLYGCGFAIPLAIDKTGLSIEFRNLLYVGPGAGKLQLMVILTGMFYSICANSFGLFEIMVPLLNKLAISYELHPLKLTLPAIMGYSHAFLFPVSTASNSVAHAFGYVRTYKMILAGIIPSIICAGVCFLFIQVFSEVAFPYIDTLPEWATKAADEE